jgi:hypothetical protein
VQHNFIAENRNKAIHELHPPPAHNQELDPKHKNYGKVPSYINKYRSEVEEKNERLRK